MPFRWDFVSWNGGNIIGFTMILGLVVFTRRFVCNNRVQWINILIFNGRCDCFTCQYLRARVFLHGRG